MRFVWLFFLLLASLGADAQTTHTIQVGMLGDGEGTITGCDGLVLATGAPFSCPLTAAIGSTVSSVTGCGGTLAANGDAHWNYTGNMPAADCTVTADFEPLVTTAPIPRRVTFTVVDPSGHPFAHAAYSIVLINAFNTQQDSVKTDGGTPFAAKPVHDSLDENGTATVQLADTTHLSPAGLKWRITISAPTDTEILTWHDAWAIQYSFAVAAPIDISASLNTLAAPVNYLNLRTGQSTITAGAGSAVSRIVAGTNITISPADGTGQVTVNATGGGGGTGGGITVYVNGVIAGTLASNSSLNGSSL